MQAALQIMVTGLTPAERGSAEATAVLMLESLGSNKGAAADRNLASPRAAATGDDSPAADWTASVQVAPHPSPGDSQIGPQPPLGLPPGMQGASAAPPDSPPPSGHAEDLMQLAK